jgi:hypothetical protein
MTVLWSLQAIAAPPAAAPAAAASAPAAAPAASHPASQPATAAAADMPDLLKDAIDVYNPMAERGRFFAAAGADSMLDEAKFKAAAGKPNSFVRKFDRWEALKQFDKSGTGKVGWPEADAYRQSFRKFVLESFDTNKDGKLTGTERIAANRALNSGQLFAGGPRPDPRLVMVLSATRPVMLGGDLPAEGVAGAAPVALPPTGAAVSPAVPVAAAPKPAVPAEDLMNDPQKKAEFLQKYDKDHTGQLGPAEREAAWRDYRRTQLEQRAQQASPQPRPEVQVAAPAQPMTEQQKATVAVAGVQASAVHDLIEKYLFEADANGVITPEAREKGLAEMHESFNWLHERTMQLGDTKGAGKLDEEDQKALAARIDRQMDKRIADWVKKYDTKGDGTLTDQERAAMEAGIRAEMVARFQSYDPNHTGHLDAQGRMRFMQDFARDLFGE